MDDSRIYSIDTELLSNHLSCVGITGMGKTTTVASILNQLPSYIKYLVLDFHNEYTKILDNYELVIKPSRDKIAYNPLKIQENMDLEEHISVIADIFSEIYGFTHPQAYYFKSVLESTLNNFMVTGEEEANLNALVKILENFPIKSYHEHETKMALLRRLKQLVEGQAKKIFIGESSFTVKELLNKNTIIEIGHIRELTIRRIYAYFILKGVYDYQLWKGEKELNHVTVLEEAKYLLPPRRDYDPPNIAEKIVNELRKFGESVFLVTQFPSQISKEALKNSGILIIHRLSGVEDIRIISNIISLTNDQIEYMKQLDRGEAIIRDLMNPLPFPVKITPYLNTMGKIS